MLKNRYLQLSCQPIWVRPSLRADESAACFLHKDSAHLLPMLPQQPSPRHSTMDPPRDSFSSLLLSHWADFTANVRAVKAGSWRCVVDGHNLDLASVVVIAR